MGLSDVQIGEQLRHRFRGHAGATVGVQGQLLWVDGLFLTALGDEALGQRGGLPPSHHPAHDIAAKAIQEDVEVEVGPFFGAFELGDIPRPDLIRRCGEQLRLGIDGVATRVAPLAHLLSLIQDTVHRAHRAQVLALVKQGGVDRSNSKFGIWLPI